MPYRVFRLAGGEPVDSLEAHVLARAYREAWRALRFSEPAGPHMIEGLGLMVEYWGQPLPHSAAADPDRR